ncbi:IclR family transcriptional regulator [Polaromonas sp.]|uniref:IclR family transcriptional regulator n=1 Tax=Polaromonas sp. TaxID=1869339 RepID=UPI003265EF55
MADLEDNNNAPQRPDTVSALERGIAVLRCFTESRRVLTPTELARLTGVPRPTVTRLASTLVTLGLLKQEPGSERFMLGPGVISIARVFLAGLDVRAVARPHMLALAEAVSGSVYLAVPDGLDMVLIEACRPRSTMLTPRLDVGSRAPMANSALGRAYLWALPLSERQSLIESLRLARGSDWAALEDGLARSLAGADKLGYCISAGEFHREINSVSVPLVGPGGEVMALNCGSAAFMFTEERLHQVVAPLLLQMARELAVDLGGHVPQPG